MKINPINNKNFGKISTSNNARKALEERLNQVELERFYRLIKEQSSNKNNICIDTFMSNTGKFSSLATEKLCATVGSNPNVYCEDFMAQKASPIAFIERLCNFANEMEIFTVNRMPKKFD